MPSVHILSTLCSRDALSPQPSTGHIIQSSPCCGCVSLYHPPRSRHITHLCIHAAVQFYLKYFWPSSVLSGPFVSRMLCEPPLPPRHHHIASSHTSTMSPCGHLNSTVCSTYCSTHCLSHFSTLCSTHCSTLCTMCVRAQSRQSQVQPERAGAGAIFDQRGL